MYQDYRMFAISSRLSTLKLVIPVISPKGGVGKSTISSMLSLGLSDKGIATGLLDLDITNPALHIILGVDVKSIELEEVNGIKPLKLTENLEFISPSFFTEDRALPLRGKDIVNVIRELLAIVNWNSIVLIIDTPPGFSDEVLELLFLIYNINPYILRPLLVTNQSTLSLVSIKRILHLIRKEITPLGIICNMCNNDDYIQDISRIYNIDNLGYIPFINDIEKIIGDFKALLKYSISYLNILINKILNIIRFGDAYEDIYSK